MHFYVNHDYLKKSLCSFIRKDHVDALLFTVLCVFLNLSGKIVSACTSSDRLEDFLADPVNRLLPLDVGVYNDNDDDFQLDLDHYRSKYKNVRLRRIHIHKKKLSNVNANETTHTQLSLNNHTTTSNLQGPSTEGEISLKHGFFCQKH